MPPRIPSERTLSGRATLALAPEIMDGPLPYPEARRALDDLDRVNRALFGVTAARRALLPRLLGGPRPGDRSGTRTLRVLDVGGGSGRLAAALGRAAERQGTAVRMVNVDRRLTHLLVGRDDSDRAPLHVAASAEALPFRHGAFDWTFSNLLFHHFGGRENRALLDEMLRCARAGAVVVDLRRSRAAAWLARLLFPLLGVGRVALHDGLLSLEQSWTAGEVEELLAGFPVVELRRRFPFRWSLVLEADRPVR